MIIKKNVYECMKCNKQYFFEYEEICFKNCPVCGNKMYFTGTYDCDTELAEKARNTPPYDPRKDPKSPYYIPVIECPYCHSTNTRRISAMSKAGSIALVGIFAAGKVSKNYHCNSCKADF